MIADYAHAAALQAAYEGDDPDVGLFTTDAWGRAFAAATGVLAALGCNMERADLEEQLVEHLHDLNSTSPEDDATVAAEWSEARRLAGVLIAQYRRAPASAATLLVGRFAPVAPVNRRAS